MSRNVDISSELSVIATEIYGSLVKNAVHDALYKVNPSSGEGKNDGPKIMARAFDGPSLTTAEYITIGTNGISENCIPGVITLEET